MISTSHSRQAKGILVHTDQHQSKELWSCLGEPQIPPQHHISLHRSCHWKKGIGKLENLTTPLIQISLIYKSCLLYYNKWFIAHASFLKGEAYFRLRISRIFAMFVKSKSNCPVKNKLNKNKNKIYNKLNHTPNLIGSYFQSIWRQRHRLYHHEQHFTSL